MAMFSSLTGDPQAQIELAKTLANLYPDNPYWSQFTNASFVDQFTKGQSREVLALHQLQKEDGNLILSHNPEAFHNSDVANEVYSKWSDAVFKDASYLTSETDSWVRAGDLDEINRYLEKAGGIPVNSVGEISDWKEIEDAYKRRMYDKALKVGKSKDIVNNGIKYLNEIGEDSAMDENERKFLEDNAYLMADIAVDGDVTIMGLTGVLDGPIETSDFGFMVVDWYGEPYTGDYTKSGGNTTITGDANSITNARLDATWTQYLKTRTADGPRITRDQFLALATEEGSYFNKAIFKAGDDAITEGQASKLIKSLNDVGGVFSIASSTLDDNVKTSMGNPASFNTLLSNATSEQLRTYTDDPNFEAKLQELVNNGEVPSATSQEEKFSYAKQTMVDESGKLYISPIYYYDGEIYKALDKVDGGYVDFANVNSESGDDITTRTTDRGQVREFIEYYNKLDSASRTKLLSSYGGDIQSMIRVLE